MERVLCTYLGWGEGGVGRFGGCRLMFSAFVPLIRIFVLIH